jgi:phosphoribosylanthranilate isomerase
VSRTRVKFCGITRVADADAAVAAGADAIGLVLDPASPRFISLEQAAMIRARLPPFVQAVALFRNASPDDVGRARQALHPDLLQFHGDESAEFCESFGHPYLRAVPMRPALDVRSWARPYRSAVALLLDAHASGQPGGQGRTFDWNAIPPGLPKPVVLAGGLTPDNVAAAVAKVRPFAVDVSSGIESAPGIKDPARMRRFIDAVRQADEA